jgi:two-component sensor histidine kinase/sensor domain CHASE-containing protein
MLRRILLFTGVTLVVMLLFITLATDRVIMNGFSAVERGFMMRNLARAENAISEQVSSLGRSASGWAARDEAYRFAQDKNESFVKANLDKDVFEDLQVDIILFLDTNGTPFFGETFDSKKGLSPGVPSALRDWLAAHPLITRLHGKASKAEGIIPLVSGPLIAALRPIVTSHHEGAVRGTLLMARFLDVDVVDQISRNLKLTITLTPLPAGQKATTPSAVIDTSREDVISGSSVLSGADGLPALMMRVDFARDIYAQARTTSLYFVAWMLAIGVVFGAVVLLVIQKSVLSRLEQLSARVLAIGTGAEPGRRIAVKGTDQIAYLGAAINGMLDALEGSHNDLRQSEQRNRAFLNAIPDMILRVTAGGSIVDARFPPRYGVQGMADTLVGISLEELTERFPAVAKGLAAEAKTAINQALETREPTTMEFTIDSDGGPLHFESRFAVSGDAEVIIVTRETTSEKRVQEAKRHEILLKEIHHRVKSNLQVISSLLSLQATAAKDPRTRGLLEESRNRVRSVALIHEKLYRGREHGGGYASYVRDLADQLLRFYKGDSGLVDVQIDVEDIPIDMDVSVSVGLILNELLSNALAHAFPPNRPGRISVGLRRTEGGRIEIAVSDNGVGFPKEIDFRNPSSLGLRIVNILAQQIQATLALDTQEGTTFLVTFRSS